jgi:hypothetical protein
MIFTGVLSLLSLVHLRQDWGAAAAADTAALLATGASLVATYNGTMLLGQTLMPCMSALLLGTLMYRSGLLPRALPLTGLIGAPCSSPRPSRCSSPSSGRSPLGRRSRPSPWPCGSCRWVCGGPGSLTGPQSEGNNTAVSKRSSMTSRATSLSRRLVRRA